MNGTFVIILVAICPKPPTPKLRIGIEEDIVKLEAVLVEDVCEEKINNKEENGHQNPAEVFVHETEDSALTEWAGRRANR